MRCKCCRKKSSSLSGSFNSTSSSGLLVPSSSGSGSLSGGIFIVPLSCCPSGVPSTFYVTPTTSGYGSPSPIQLLNGPSVPMIYDSSTGYWNARLIYGGNVQVCQGPGFGVGWNFTNHFAELFSIYIRMHNAPGPTCMAWEYKQVYGTGWYTTTLDVPGCLFTNNAGGPQEWFNFACQGVDLGWQLDATWSVSCGMVGSGSVFRTYEPSQNYLTGAPAADCMGVSYTVPAASITVLISP